MHNHPWHQTIDVTSHDRLYTVDVITANRVNNPKYIPFATYVDWKL